MALGTPANMTSGSSAGGTNSFTTASISPTSGDLIFASVGVSTVTPGSSKIGAPRISGDGLIFNLLTKQENAATTSAHWVLWAIADGSATSGTLTISWTTGPSSAISWVIDKVTGFDTSSSIAWCVQAAQAYSSSSATAPAVTLQSVQDANSLVYATVECTWTAAQLSPGTGFTQLAEQAGTAHLTATMYKLNDAAVTWAITTGTNRYLVTAIEITASNAGGRNNPLALHSLGCSGAGF